MSDDENNKVTLPLHSNAAVNNVPLEKAAQLAGVKEKEIVNKKKPDSGLQAQQTLPAILKGLDVPNETRGPFTPIDRDRWLNVVEVLMQRNIKSTRAAAEVTGLTAVTVGKFMNEVRDMWKTDLTSQKVNYRREVLYSENERIADFCWNMINIDPTAKEVPQYLKIIGETNTRRSRLVGAEQITLAVGKIENNNVDTNQIQQQAATKLGVSVSALKEMGDLFATKMLPSYIDAEFEEVEENENEKEDSYSEDED